VPIEEEEEEEEDCVSFRKSLITTWRTFIFGSWNCVIVDLGKYATSVNTVFFLECRITTWWLCENFL